MRPALVALFFGATCIALSPIFVRLSEAGPTATAFWRVALAVPLLWIFFRPPLKGPKLLFLAAGIAFAGDLAFWHKSIQFTSVANSTLLANLASIFVTLATWLLWREKPRSLFLVALGLALGGVALLVHTSLDFSPTALLGDALGVVTAMAVTSTLTAVILLPVALASGEPMLPSSAYGWGVLLGLALISHAAGQGLIVLAAIRLARRAST